MRLNPAPAGYLRCPQCGVAALPEVWQRAEVVKCGSCGSRLHLRIYPAALVKAAVQTGEAAVPGDATCFFHEGKKAERVCDQCGRFVCPLCDLPVGPRHVCPACLGSGLEKAEKLPELVMRRTCWGQFSLALAGGPLLVCIPLFFLFPLLFFTAAAAIFCALYGWNKPPSLVRGRGHARAVLAIILGLLQLGGLALFFILLSRGSF